MFGMQAWITLAQAAEVIGIHPSTLSRHCNAGRIRARKALNGYDWEVHRLSAERWKKLKRGPKAKKREKIAAAIEALRPADRV